MTNRPFYGFLLLLLSVLAAASLWLEYVVQTQQPIGRWLPAAHTADYMVRHLKMTRTDVQGQKQYTLWADFAEHFPGDDTTDLTLPVLVAQDATQGTLTVHADRAFATSKAKQVNFMGHVIVVRDVHDKQGPITLTTSFLEAFPDQQVLYTPDPVLVVGKLIHLTAVGFTMNNRSQWLDLKHKVKAHYDVSR